MTFRLPARMVLAIAPFVFLLLALLGIAPIHSRPLAQDPRVVPVGSAQSAVGSR